MDWSSHVAHRLRLPGNMSSRKSQVSRFDKVMLLRTGFSGELPASWAGAFPQLSQLNLQNNSFSGQVPASWAQANAFPSLENIILTENELTGELCPFALHSALQKDRQRLVCYS